MSKEGVFVATQNDNLCVSSHSEEVKETPDHVPSPFVVVVTGDVSQADVGDLQSESLRVTRHWCHKSVPVSHTRLPDFDRWGRQFPVNLTP